MGRTAFGVLGVTAACLALAPAAFAVDFFPPPTSPEPSGGSTAFGVSVADFNGDAKDDLAVANGSSANVGILLGNGGGDFTAAPTSPEAAGSGARMTGVGDFNGDGNADMAVANETSNIVTILLGNGGGDFTAAPTSPETVGTDPNSLAVGDFNGDGKADLAVANAFVTTTLTVLLGAGNGDFTEAGTSPETLATNPDTVVTGEFNGDGKPDLAATRPGGVEILLGAGGGDFVIAPTSPEPAGDTPRQVVIGEFNGDGQPDLATANQVSDDVTVLLGAGTGDFTAAATSPEASGDTSDSLTTGDFDQNGTTDLAVGNIVADTVTTLVGAGTGDFTAAPTSPEPGGNGPEAIARGDFNQDGVDDLAVADSTLPGTVTILLGIAHPLSVLARGTGAGFVDSSRAGIDCGRELAGHEDCSNLYADGAPITLTAHPEPGSTFEGFFGAGCTGPGLTCTVTMNQAQVANATFTDTAPPETKITKKPKRRTTKEKAKFKFTSSEEESKFTCRLDKEKPKPCKDGFQKRVEPGKHVFSVFATDDAGNDDPTPAKVRWTLLED